MNEIARTPELIATEINVIKDQTRRMMLYNSIEIGRRLAEAREMVSHGEWSNWLEHSVNYSKSTANNLIRIFQEYGSEQITLLNDNAKSEAFAKLSYSQAVALLGVPEEDREAFIAENDVENMSTRELQQAIKERNEAIERAKEAENKRIVLDAKLKEKYTEVERLKSQLEKAQSSGNDEEVESLQNALNVLHEEVDKAKARAAELEKQLKETPIEVVEKIPEDVQKELEELRNKAGQVTEDVAKFKALFDILVKNFSSLLEALERIQDVDTKEKYRTAVEALIGKMKERL